MEPQRDGSEATPSQWQGGYATSGWRMPICGFKQGLNESLSYKKSSQKAAPQKPWQWELGTVMFLLP